nr:hypothetical protein [Streptacidiphilus jeojiense]
MPPAISEVVFVHQFPTRAQYLTDAGALVIEQLQLAVLDAEAAPVVGDELVHVAVPPAHGDLQHLVQPS